MNNKNFNAICGVDEFGRVILPQGEIKQDKTVGMFYFAWLGSFNDDLYDINKLLEEDQKALWDTSGSEQSPGWGFHYWGEPLYGYYKSDARFVIRKHIEMLTMAGIDYIMFDTTNAQIYPNVISAMFEELDRYSKAGWDVPKVACFTNSGSVQTIKLIWENFYNEKSKFSHLWYAPNGKPIIAGSPDLKTEDPEMYEFFDLRVAQWPTDTFKENGFPWMEWIYPQPIHNGIISVSVAQHAKGTFGMQEGNWGRGYDHEGNENHDNFRLGQNFQKQWDTAVENDAKEIFLTGWNEWGAQKLTLFGETAFCDCFSEEYSRDIEPMKGGYGDSFYMQTIQNIRRFKQNKSFSQKNKMKTIEFAAGIEQWEEIDTVYFPMAEDNYFRDELSINETEYKTKPANNNIQQVKVTHDQNNFYFLVKCENDITDNDQNPNWLNVFISAGMPKKQGWEGYRFVANRRKTGSLDELNLTGNTITYNMTDCVVTGKYMQLAIPREIIGATDCGMYFKVADSVEKFRDINDYYVTGKVLPMGRLSFYYEV